MVAAIIVLSVMTVFNLYGILRIPRMLMSLQRQFTGFSRNVTELSEAINSVKETVSAGQKTAGGRNVQRDKTIVKNEKNFISPQNQQKENYHKNTVIER